MENSASFADRVALVWSFGVIRDSSLHSVVFSQLLFSADTSLPAPFRRDDSSSRHQVPVESPAASLAQSFARLLHVSLGP